MGVAVGGGGGVNEPSDGGGQAQTGRCWRIPTLALQWAPAVSARSTGTGGGHKWFPDPIGAAESRLWGCLRRAHETRGNLASP